MGSNIVLVIVAIICATPVVALALTACVAVTYFGSVAAWRSIREQFKEKS